MWESVGMRVYEVSPEEHDAIVAGVSHLPHLVAGALCNTAAGFPSGDLRKYAGPGFRDCTRVSSGNPEIWDSIVADNRDAILAALRNFSGELSEIVSALERRDFAKIGGKLRSAKAYRDKL